MNLETIEIISATEAMAGDENQAVHSPTVEIASPPTSAASVVKHRTYHAACRVCTSDRAPEVESLMAMGVAATAVAKRIGGGISADSVRRHWGGHVPPDRKASLIGKMVFDKDSLNTVEKLDREKADERDNLFLRLRAQRGLLWDLVNPTKNPDRKSQVNAHAVLLRLTELIAKVLGEIQTGSNINVSNQTLNVSGSDIMELRRTVETALKPWPAARTALLDALSKKNLPAPEA